MSSAIHELVASWRVKHSLSSHVPAIVNMDTRTRIRCFAFLFLTPSSVKEQRVGFIHHSIPSSQQGSHVRYELCRYCIVRTCTKVGGGCHKIFGASCGGGTDYDRGIVVRRSIFGLKLLLLSSKTSQVSSVKPRTCHQRLSFIN